MQEHRCLPSATGMAGGCLGAGLGFVLFDAGFFVWLIAHASSRWLLSSSGWQELILPFIATLIVGTALGGYAVALKNSATHQLNRTSTSAWFARRFVDVSIGLLVGIALASTGILGPLKIRE
jgi:hypothetical protein